LFENEFTQMLGRYSDAVSDRRKFIGLMKDIFPDQPMQANLVNTVFDLGIAKEIISIDHISNAFAFRFVKRLVDEFGISRLNADWAVSVWCVCFGQRILHKSCDIKISAAKSGAAPAIKEERSPDTGKQYAELFRYTRIPSGYGVTGFSGQNKRTIIFPNMYNGQPVKKIMASAFAKCEVQEVIMTDGIEIIEEDAFKGCLDLKQVIFSNTLKEIGDCTFEGCGSLVTAALPIGVEQLGRYAFSNTGLKGVFIPQSVYWTGEGVYSNCKKLNNVAIPNNIISIPNGMFCGCEALADISLPETIDGIGESAFEGCSALQSITIPESVRCIGERAFVDVHPKFTILCQRQSVAEQYARKHDITFQIIY